MIEATTFAGQNWLITPAALAVNEARPQNISGQNWLLVLSGVTIINFKGKTSNDWLRDTVHIQPDLQGPLQHAISRYSIPHPLGSGIEFRVDQWSPFAAMSSIFNQNESVNSGFAVDVWRPSPFVTATDATSNQLVNNLFTGINVDIAVRDSDAWLYRVSYNITLLGRIVFTKIIIQ